MKKATRKATDVTWFKFTGEIKKKKFDRLFGLWFLDELDDDPVLCVVHPWSNEFIRIDPGEIVVYDDYTEEFEAMDEDSFRDLYDVKD